MRLVKFETTNGGPHAQPTGVVWINPEHVRTVQGREGGACASINFYRGGYGDTVSFESVMGSPAEVVATLGGKPENPRDHSSTSTHTTDEPDPVLDLLMRDNDAGASTVRGYLTALLATVWAEEQGFSGKRPFGNSGWQWDLYRLLIDAELISGAINEYGEIEECDDKAGNKLIADAILRMGGAA